MFYMAVETFNRLLVPILQLILVLVVLWGTYLKVSIGTGDAWWYCVGTCLKVSRGTDDAWWYCGILTLRYLWVLCGYLLGGIYGYWRRLVVLCVVVGADLGLHPVPD